MNDIEDFLRRLAQEKLRDFADDDDDEIIDAELVDDDDEEGIMYVADVVNEGPERGGVASVFTEERMLGSTLEKRDDRMEQHVHEVFDHRLGQLGESADESAAGKQQKSADPSQSTVTEFVARLSSPHALRDAIILSEIIRRPEERW